MPGTLSDEEEEITGINVTPLVDVMLVLLVIFMVTASYIVQRSIEVKLPKAETATMSAKTKNLGFVIDSKSNLFLDGNVITWPEISTYIEKAKQELKDDSRSLQALISADRTTPHGVVVRLIDSIRKNGISEFAINVEAVDTTADINKDNNRNEDEIDELK